MGLFLFYLRHRK
ncbi:hypothetical protein GKZ89_19865 [Bacillus mangrovi]|uniref:Uncharacterized protein n=1 Tax=Metabacillus mangrovi TaxID=1491830 RepID=A0A7X2S8X3_9BACI|nr:hypothetical protein [Metabacillus mangrovi]